MENTYTCQLYLDLLKKLIARLKSQLGSSLEEDPKYKAAIGEHINASAGKPNVKWTPPEVIAEDIQELQNEFIQEMQEKSQQITGEIKQGQIDAETRNFVESTESAIRNSMVIGKILMLLSALSWRLQGKHDELVKSGKPDQMYLDLSNKVAAIYNEYTFKTGVFV